MEQIQFVEALPPKTVGRRPGSGKVQRIIEQAKQRPGEWAILATGIKSPSYYYILAKKDGKIAVQTRRNEDGTFTVYARYDA